MLNADEQINDSGILGANLFVYCYNNPVNMVDNDGREPITINYIGIYFLATAVIAIYTIVVVSTPQFQRSWSQMCIAVAGGISSGLGAFSGAMSGAISWASSRAKSIAKSIGDSFARTKTMPKYRSPREIHHIVAQQAPNVSLNVGLGYNSPYNLVSLKTGLHRRLHTNEYYGWANSVIISAHNSANGNKAKQRSNVIGALVQ